MKLNLLIPFVAFLCCLISCKEKSKINEINVLVNTDKVFQRIEGFGASDCWTTQFVGKNWPVSKREAIADLLFSKELDDAGNPKGIALSQWRFNIGAGTTEQGNKSEIPSPWRRAECFMNADGSYNWSKQEGQQWFLRAAKERGVEKLLAFNNCAPVYFTKNGKGWSPGGTSYNLKADKVDDYAKFLTSVYEYFDKQGLGFDYVSPFNEPQWDWKSPATQEGSPAENKNIASVVKELSPLLAKNLPNTKIVVPEAAQLQFLYKKGDYKHRDNQINAFFNDTSSLYLKDLPNLQNAALGHSYFTTSNEDTLIKVRENLRDLLEADYPDLEYWQSEYCILESHNDIGDGNHRDLGMNTALYVGRVIHSDLVYGNASLWCWWTALTAVDYKDGLVYIDRGGDEPFKRGKVDSLQYDGEYHDSKLLWALGNYSRFIHPGMYRFEVKMDNESSPEKQLENIMISGYKTLDDKKIVFVVINYSDQDKALSFNNLFESKESGFEHVKTYLTSETKNLECSKTNKTSVRVPSKSVMTIVCD